MENAAYLIAIIIGVAGQNVLKKPYTQKKGSKGVYFFIACVSAAAALFFVATSGGFRFDFAYVPYSVGFATSYAVSSVFTVLAVAFGSLSLTSLFTSFSLMIPTFFGLLFLRESIGVGFIPGLLLLSASLFLINKKDEEIKFSPKWIVCVLLSFVGNGMCSVVQKMQQLAQNGAYKNEFMIVALVIVTAIMLILTLTTERKDVKQFAKTGWHLSLICGLLNGMVNLFVMILSNKMSVSLMFPLISAGGLVVTYFVSRFFYKEKLSKMQLAGFICGAAAVIFLNI